MYRTWYLKQKTRDFRLVFRMGSTFSSVTSANEVDIHTPAWLDATCRPPKVSTAISTIFLQSASCKGDTQEANIKDLVVVNSICLLVLVLLLYP